MSAIFLKGFLLGWSVAWPPGPVNAEMIRRSILAHERGGGFWPAWWLGLGACTGDFFWALAVALGAGALMNTPRVRFVLEIVSLILLLVLAFVFARGAWRTYRAADHVRAPTEILAPPDARLSGSRRTYLLGMTLTLTSPWNIGFWLAVIGSQRTSDLQHSFASSLCLAVSVVLGAATWGLVLCLAARQAAPIFARPAWQILTQLLTCAVMIFFAAKLFAQFL